MSNLIFIKYTLKFNVEILKILTIILFLLISSKKYLLLLVILLKTTKSNFLKINNYILISFKKNFFEETKRVVKKTKYQVNFNFIYYSLTISFIISPSKIHQFATNG